MAGAGNNPPKAQITTELSRELSLFQLTMMGVGMMIGAGVFLGIGNAIGLAGPGGLMLTFTLNTLLALIAAMSYAELSSAIPKAGGAYNFARIAFGRAPSFLGGWIQWFASAVAGSAYSLAFSVYTLGFLQQLGLLGWLPVPLAVAEKIVAAAVVLAFVYVNYRGVSETGKTGALLALGQTCILGVIGVAGVVVYLKDPSRLANFEPFMPAGWSKLLVTMGFTYLAFEGFEVIAQAGEEAIEPRRNLPKAMLLSVFVVGTMYILVSFASVVAVKAGSDGVDGPVWEWIGGHGVKGFGAAVSRLMPLGSLLATLCVIFASTSALNATIYSATRVSYALGRDGMLPSAFARISAVRKTPHFALGVTALLVIAVAILFPTLDVTSTASILFLFLFLMVNLCVIKIRRHMGDELTYGFVMPFFPVLPIVAIVFQVLAAVWLFQASWIAWAMAAMWTVAGLVVYFSYSRSHAVTVEEDIVVLEEEIAPKGEEFQIIVPVANPSSAARLVINATKLCGAKQARVNLVHIVTVPDQVPLSDAHKYMMPGREAIVEAMIYLAPKFPITTTIRYCRNVARGIVAAARDRKADLIVMGWHGRQRRSRLFAYGSVLDPVVENAPCDVVIFKDCPGTQFKRILLLYSGGPNSVLAAEIASILMDPAGGEAEVLNVTRPGRHTMDIEAYLDECAAQIERFDKERFRPKYLVSKNVFGAIMDEMRREEYDLVVLGVSARGILDQMLRGSIAEQIARGSDKAMAMVRAKKGIRSLIRRYI